MLIGAGIVPGRSVSVRQLRCKLAAYKGFKSLVNRRQGDVGNLASDSREDLVGRRMLIGSRQDPIHRGTLFCEALTVRFECLPEGEVDPRSGIGGEFHDLQLSSSRALLVKRRRTQSLPGIQ